MWCVRLRLAVVICAGLGVHIAAAGSEPTLRASIIDDQPSATLLLEVWLNGATRGVVVSVHMDAGAARVAPDELKRAGIDVDRLASRAAPMIALSGIDGMTFEVDASSQRLLLTAREDQLLPRVVDLRPALVEAEWGSASTGLIFDYDISASTDDVTTLVDTGQVGGTFGLTAFTPWGIATMTGFGQSGRYGDRAVRFDSYISVDDPERRRQWLVGDAISGGLRWSRSVRFGGVQLRSDFSLQPGLSTLPMPDYFGSTAVPASIDVFVDSQRVYQTNIDQGPFELRNLPIMTSNGDVTVVVRDALGRETIENLSIFVTPAMLAKGLFAYTLDAGMLRHGYGEESFDYEGLVAAATARYGLSDALTVEVHTEASDDLILGGLGAVLSLAPFAVVSAAAAHSSSGAGSGQLYSIAAESRLKPFSFFASWDKTAGAYADLGSADGDLPPNRLQLGAAVNFARYGSLSASWIEIDRHDDDERTLGNLSYSLSLGGGSYFGLSTVYDGEAHDWAGEAYVSVALGDAYYASGSSDVQHDVWRHRATVERQIDGETGFGYALSGEVGELARASGRGDWFGTTGAASGELAVTNDVLAARVGVTGSIVNVDDSLFMARQANDAFALVRTGQEGVRVYRENREVARTDSDGELLVSGLPAYSPTSIGIEPHDFPMSVVLDTAAQRVAPRRRSVAVVDLAPAQRRPLIVQLVLRNGEAPLAGSSVKITGMNDELVVGRHGKVFVPDVRARLHGIVDWGDGVCLFSVDAPLAVMDDGIPEVGPVVCQEANR